jgi:hypothetical protein
MSDPVPAITEAAATGGTARSLPTSARCWASIAPLVNAGHRVMVPDMIGFGLSEKPAREQAHSLDGHIANLTGLVRQLDLQRLTVVCHDWGGPTGLGFAMSNPGRVRALTVMSTWAWPTPPAEFHTRLFPWRMTHAPLIGPYLLGRHNVLARRGVYLSVVGRDKFRHEAQPVYEAVLPDAETRLLTWVWPRWIPLDDTARARARFTWLEAELAKSKLPALTRGRGVRRCDFCRTLQASDAARRRAAHGDRPTFLAGRLRSGNRGLGRRLPGPFRRTGSFLMADVAVIGRPANEDTRQALVLTEDRVGHYPEFRAFFVRTFDLDRVGLSEPGYVQAPSGLAYALVFIGRSGEPFPAGLEVYAIVPALEPLDDVVVDRDLWAILGWMIDGVGAPWTWKDCTPQAGSIASPQPRDLISASLELTDRLTAPAGAQALIETNTC